MHACSLMSPGDRISDGSRHVRTTLDRLSRRRPKDLTRISCVHSPARGLSSLSLQLHTLLTAHTRAPKPAPGAYPQGRIAQQRG